jgi:hypothetical protein
VGIVMFLATIPAVLYVDKFGRKTILIVGGIGMAVSHFIVAGYGYDRHYLLFENTLTILAASRARTRVISRTTKALLGPLSSLSGFTPSTLAIRESTQPQTFASLLLTLLIDGAPSLGSSSPKSFPSDCVPKVYRSAALPTGSTM